MIAMMRAALPQASILAAPGFQGNNANGQGINQSRENAEKQLAMYLSMMRGLRQKIAEGGGNNNNSAGDVQPQQLRVAV